MSITRLALRQQLGAEETGLATLGTATDTGTTTTIVASGLAGAYSASRWSRGTAIRISSITGGTVADATNTTLDSYAPATGTVTVLPVIAAPVANDTFEIWSAVDSVDEVDDAINRGLQRHCFHWVPIPLTKVTDGDMGKAAIEDWTEASATSSKVDVSFPDTVANHYLEVITTSADGYLYSANLACKAGDTWRINVLVRSASGGGSPDDSAELRVYDVTNTAQITLTGDGTTYSGKAWQELNNTFTIPSGCLEFQIWLGADEDNETTHWTHIICHEVNETQFLVPARIGRSRLGRVMYRRGEDVEHFHFEEYCQSGRGAHIQRDAAGTIVRLSHGPGTGDPVYVEELCTYEGLSTDSATTECDEELALACIKYELLKGLANKGYALPTPQGYLAPSEWRLKKDEALREMQSKQASIGAESKAVFR